MAPMPPTTPVPAGRWVERWLSKARHAVYLSAAGADTDRALARYEWNAQLSAALMRDLAHLEVGLRNAYDAAIVGHWTGSDHWTWSSNRLFPPLFRTRHGRRVDVNERRRDQLDSACAQAGPAAPPGKVIAELPFGFWRYLSSAAHEKTIWVRYLHHAFPPGTDRKTEVDDRVVQLHSLRNRVAHHEPLLRENIAAHVTAILSLTHLFLPQLAQQIAATSATVTILNARP
jgi:Abi-like protein